jgi:hypothetical protein
MHKAKIEFENLRVEMARANIGVKEIAETIGTNRDTASRKLSRKSPIQLAEAFAIRDKYFPELTLSYLFREISGEYIAVTRIGNSLHQTAS